MYRENLSNAKEEYKIEYKGCNSSNEASKVFNLLLLLSAMGGMVSRLFDFTNNLQWLSTTHRL